MSSTTEQRIFISYRRDDCQPQANGLNDGLRNRLPDARVFMDIDSIPIGADFEEHIRGEIEQCDVALILIGDDWLASRPGTNKRRIDEPNDFVRLEVESALSAKDLRVIPVLVEGATMPTPEELPRSIRRLARLNAFELSDKRWTSDIQHLTQQLQGLAGGTTTAAPTRDDRTTPAYAPPPRPVHPEPSSPPAPARTSYPQPPLPQSAPAIHQASPAPVKTGRKARTMILWCVLTMGLASWAAPLWAANRRPYDKPFRRRMQMLAAGLGVAVLVGVMLISSAPEDAEGSPTGAGSDFGATLVLLAMAAGVAVVLAFRKPQVVLAGTQSVLARRDSRERYRQLVEKDRPLARSMHVGRPDVPRDYDDGGLLDVNSIPAHVLSQHAGLNDLEAAKVVEMRGQLGRFVSLDELLAYVDLPETTATRLRDVAVFV